jgi:small subunit ribosomal protein S18
MNKSDFSYKNYEELAQYMTDRARILSRAKTGLSPKKQKQLVRAIKRARFLGLLPYSAK